MILNDIYQSVYEWIITNPAANETIILVREFTADSRDNTVALYFGSGKYSLRINHCMIAFLPCWYPIIVESNTPTTYGLSKYAIRIRTKGNINTSNKNNCLIVKYFSMRYA